MNQRSSRLLVNESPMMVLPSLVMRIGLNEAIVLQQIQYWIRGNEERHLADHYIDGRWWTYNTFEKWQKSFPWWSTRTIKRVMKTLEDAGLVIPAKHGRNGTDHTKWYTIDYDAVNALLARPCQKVTDHDAKKSPPIVPKSHEPLYTETSYRDYSSESNQYRKASRSAEASRDNALHSNNHENAVQDDQAQQRYSAKAINANTTTAKPSRGATGSNQQHRTVQESLQDVFDAIDSTHSPNSIATNICGTVKKLKTGTPPVSPPLPAPAASAPTFLPSRQKTAKLDLLTVDSDGWLRLPNTPATKLPSFLATRRMQYWLAFEVVGCAEPSSEDGYVLIDGNQLLVSSRKDKLDDMPEDDFFSSDFNFALGALRSYAVAHHGMTKQWFNEAYESFYRDSVQWCRETGDTALATRKTTSTYLIFDGSDVPELDD